MLITLTEAADVARVRATLQAMGLWTQAVEGARGRALTVEAHSPRVAPEAIRAVPGVADVLLQKSPHPRVDAFAGQSVTVAGAEFGVNAPPVLIAGPCSAESEETAHRSAAMAATAGARLMRGGAFKPRTSPYSFQGAGPGALRWLREAADAHGLGLVTEAMSEAAVARVAEVADLIQVGSRNMQNFALLKTVGRTGRPVLLKRGMGATVEEWLLAGEHLVDAGASGVIFCERGVQGFDPSTRYLLDLAAVALMTHVHKLPVVVDPSHGTGRRDLVPIMARAGLAAGACGLIVEAHPDPAAALSDGPQALDARGLAQVAAHMRAAQAAFVAPAEDPSNEAGAPQRYPRQEANC